MIAAQLYAPRDLRLEDVREPEPGAGEVKIAVAHNGLCGTDLQQFFDGPLACSTVPHPITGAVLPQILGHEFAGVVVETGPEVEGVEVGDRVCVATLYACGECDRCRAGLRPLCRDVTTHGLCSDGGGLAQYTVVAGTMVDRLPPEMTLAQGALVEPMAVAFSGVLRAGVEPGGSALVFGAGPIGIGVTLGLRAIGVTDIIVAEPAAARRAAIEALGIADVIDPGASDVTAVVRRRTGGRGVDAALDCAGVPTTFSLAPDVLAARGRYVVLAMSFSEVGFVPFLLTRHEIELTGSLGYTRDVFTRVLHLIADGAFPTDGWVEHLPLADVHAALEELRAGRRMKVLLDLPGVDDPAPMTPA